MASSSLIRAPRAQGPESVFIILNNLIFNMKTRIVRHTSPSKAIKLAKTGEFILRFKDPLNADHGFNGFIKSRMKEYNQSQEYTDVGAIIELEWVGEFIEMSSDSTSPLPTNVLIH